LTLSSFLRAAQYSSTGVDLSTTSECLLSQPDRGLRARGLRGLPGLAHRAGREPLLAGCRQVLEVGALGLGNPRDPGAVALVEEARGALGAVGLARLDRDGRRRLG